jgi:uncharacterized membrane protein
LEIRPILDFLFYAIEYTCVGIITYGAVMGIIRLIRLELSRFKEEVRLEKINKIRIDFGYYLLLGLEFLIAADIIHTISAPTLEELYELGGIVIIRTVLSYFLNKEIENGKHPARNKE